MTSTDLSADTPPTASWWRSPRARWAVPAVVTLAVAGAFAVPALASAGDADLPDRTPAEVLAAVVAADPVPLSGTVVHTARLGLPDLPFGDMADAGPMALLGGSSTLRIWSDGEDRARVALLGATSEYSMVRDGFEAWSYSSAKNEVVHYAPPAEQAALLEQLMGDGGAGQTPMPSDLVDPDALARAVLEVAEESSIVSMDADTTVAGRGAYQLVVTPESRETLVARVVVAVDAETSLPLRLQVWSTQDADAPALEVGYTDISFTAPDPEALEFSVPVGATVREVEIPLHGLGLPFGPGMLPEGTDLSGLDLSGLDLSGMDLGDLSQLGEPGATADLEGALADLGLEPADLQRLAELEGPERLAAMQDLMAGLDLGALAEHAPQGAVPGDGVEAPGLRVLGSGWTTVVELSEPPAGAVPGTAPDAGPAGEPAPQDLQDLPGSATAEDLFAELDQSIAGMHDAEGDVDLFATLATEVPEGRLITSALFSVLVTDDGRMLMGAVPGEVLRGLA